MRTIHVAALACALLAMAQAVLGQALGVAAFAVLATVALFEAARQDRRAAAVIDFVEREVQRRKSTI